VAITPFKVADFGTNQKPMQLPIIE